VPQEDLIPIGRFARLSGLTVHTLRHYDDVGLLTPADVDPDTGYRRYRRSQLATARLIASLRWVDLPVDRVRVLLQSDVDPDTASQILTEHRRRLERDRRLTDDRLRDTRRFIERGLVMPKIATQVRPCQIKLGVHDVEKAAAFYSSAFGMRYDIIRRTGDEEIYGLMLGEYGNWVWLYQG
jgi:DNA-binding transcriptional MerR regulator